MNYTKQTLSNYPYFAKELEEHEMSDVLDSLTGLVSRAFIMGFVHSLLDAGTPFTFAILDLDNFKFINDTYGHRVGDGVLIDVAHNLIDYLGEAGVAGRFGGDEFLFVNLRDISYDEKKHFLEGMYFNYRVLRKNVALHNCNPFITGTVGCATYPDDAQDYDGLFALIDKTLYRGKTKGRNCYIIYVEEKHKNIEIQKLAKEGIYTTFHRLAFQFDLLPDTHSRLQAALEGLKDELRITDLFYIGEKRVVRSLLQPGLEEEVPDIDTLMAEDLYSSNRPWELKDICPMFYAFVREYEIESILIVRMSVCMHEFGYLMCAEPRNQRIWQEDERAILFFTSRLLAEGLERDRETL